ncbi:hypothetical protein MTO96_010374 [Rhipicephalus appendiculatus]
MTTTALGSPSGSFSTLCVLADLLRRLPQPESSSAPRQADVATFQVMPDLSKNISDFAGDGCASAARDWMEGLRQTATLHRWPTPFLLETAKSHLVGAAKDWYHSRSAEISSWEDFERTFRRTFYSQTRAAERWRRMQERVQQRNENTAAYFHAKVRLCRDARLDFCDTREQVLTGLRSRELCTMLLGRSHEDEDDLLHDIEEFERIDRDRRQRFGGASERGAPSNPPRMQPAPRTPLQDTFGYSSRDKRPPITNTNGERKCYNCSKFGHISRDCPEERRVEKCLKCGKFGHTQRHCQDSSTKSETNTVSAEKVHPGVLLKHVKWNGEKTLVGMIDTGSSGCLLRESAAVQCGAEMLEDATALYGFGSQGVPAVRAIGKCRADLVIDGVVGKNIPILVVPDGAQSVDLLVGRTFTELPYVTYARLGGSLHFWHKSECPFSHLETLTSCPKLRLKTAEETTLQANVINWVRLSSQSNVTGPVLFNNCGHEILIDMEGGEVTVPVFTSGRDDVVLRKGQRLGHATEVDIPGCEGMGENNCKEECGAAESEQILVTETRRPIMREEITVGPSVSEAQHPKDWDELIMRLRLVLGVFRKANLTLRLTKCAFAMDTVDFLGFRLKSGTVQPGETKVRAIAEFPTPKNVHDVRRFLGLTSFFRRFIPRYALTAEPLTRLTKKDAAFEWSAEQDESFMVLKERLTCEPVLQLYDPNAETELHTDASTKGLAAMLLQRKGDEWHLVYCVSKKTTDAESNYHSSKLEQMAIVWAVDRLRPLLLGISFTIVTDCQALVYLNAQRTLKPQIARWYDLIQEFTFTIKHRPGSRMLHVDSLSRGAVEDPTDTMCSLLAERFEVCVTFTVADQVLALQRGDEELRELIAALEKPPDCRTEDERRKTEGYSIKDGGACQEDRAG